MGGALKGIGQAAGNVGGPSAKIVQTLNLGPGVGGLISDILEGGAQRERFISILLGTIAHVEKKKNFNLEVEINDLLVRLGNLRQGPSGAGGMGGGVGGGLTSNALLGPGIENILKDMIGGVVRAR